MAIAVANAMFGMAMVGVGFPQGLAAPALTALTFFIAASYGFGSCKAKRRFANHTTWPFALLAVVMFCVSAFTARLRPELHVRGVCACARTCVSVNACATV